MCRRRRLESRNSSSGCPGFFRQLKRTLRNPLFAWTTHGRRVILAANFTHDVVHLFEVSDMVVEHRPGRARVWSMCFAVRFETRYQVIHHSIAARSHRDVFFTAVRFGRRILTCIATGQ